MVFMNPRDHLQMCFTCVWPSLKCISSFVKGKKQNKNVLSQKTDQMVESGIILQWEAEPLDCGGVGGGGGGMCDA